MGINSKRILFFLTTVFACSACSSTSWVVQDDVMDPNDFEKVHTSYFLESTNKATPTNPVVQFSLKASETYHFSTRVRTERYIQRYRPRLSYVLLGAAGTGLSFYAALSDNLIKRPTLEQQYALMGTGTLLTGLSLLNMRPVGEPKPTGEIRLLRKTGIATEIDTTDAIPYTETAPVVTVTYGGQILIEDAEWRFEGNQININLAEEINTGIISANETILVEVVYDSLYANYSLTASDILEQFAVVQAQITALRNSPNTNSDNVLTDLGEGSQLKLISAGEEWHKVLYGISEAYISAKDAKLIWQPSEFASSLSVVTIPNIPFGMVDVEQDIPVLGTSSLNSSAFIISNFKFGGDLSERAYGERDAKLMEEYFIQAIGIRESRIVKAVNAENTLQIERAYARLANSVQPNQSLTVYMNGYAEVRNGELYLLGSGNNPQSRQYINLHSLFSAFTKLPVGTLIIYADLDILNGENYTDLLAELAKTITDHMLDSAIIFSSKESERSRIYSSAEGKKTRHSIFTYYLADGMKKGNTRMNFLFNYLDRNVTFTSRSIYDRPQNPLFFGNRELSIVN